MKERTLAAWALVAVLVLTGTSAFAQTGIPNLGGGKGGSTMRPQRKLKKRAAPVLSPTLNLLPQAATTFEGLFLMRQLPQEQLIRATARTERKVEPSQSQLAEEEAHIKSGLSKSGHDSKFMNSSSYYAYRGARGRHVQ